MQDKKHLCVRHFLEALLWTVVAFAAADAFRLAENPQLSNDSYQYLSVAGNIESGQGMSTSLIYFDAERGQDRIPALTTTFPPLYPILIAGLDRFVGDLELSGRLVSMMSFAISAGMLTLGLCIVNAPPLVRVFMLLLFVADAANLRLAGSAVTEPLFTLLVTSVVVGLLWVESRVASGHFPVLATAFLLLIAGAACWVRYAGYFVVFALVLYALALLVRDRSRQRLILLALYAIPLTLVAALLLRNYRIAGNWRGGNELTVHHALASVLKVYLISHYHLLFGNHVAGLGFGEALVLLSLIAFSIPAVLVLMRIDGIRLPSPLLSQQCLLLGIVVLTYTMAMIWAGLRSDISFGGRMFVPIVPLYLLLFAMLLTALYERIALPSLRFAQIAAVCLFVLGVACANGRDFARVRQPAHYAVVASLFNGPTSANQTLLDWVHQNTARGEVFLAEDGQATGFALGYPTIGMVDSEYSRINWNCNTVLQTLRQFHARYVILYRSGSSASEGKNGIDANAVLTAESPFVSKALGNQVPCGFAIAAENSHVRILRAPR